MKKITEAEKIEIAKRLREFQTPSDLKSYLVVIGNILGLAACFFGGYYLYQIHPLYTALFWIPTVAFFVRSAIGMHDCGHKSMFSTTRQNMIVGRICGMTIGIPFKLWEHFHNLHHTISNNLDKRHLDLESSVMTHEEYKNAPFFKRLGYDFTRNPVARVLIVPINAYILYKIPFWFYPKKIIIDTAISTIIYAFLIYGLLSLVSFPCLLFIFAIPMFLTQVMMASVFILQHKFEKAVWYDDADWDHFEVALHGSSYIKFGKFMDWFSGGIGYHHIHHLNPKIPFYNLSKCEKSVREVVAVDPIYLSAYFRHMKAKVWDNAERRMVKPD